MKKFLFLFFLSTFYLLSSWADDNIITFADENVKAICVANWDTDGDGELGYEEAAAVTELGEVFKDNTEISFFNELQYFTGITEIKSGSFLGCESLTSISIPSNVESIEGGSFEACRGLVSITIPSSVTSIDYNPFIFCNNLTTIVVSSDNPVYDSREGCNAIIETASNTIISSCSNTVIPSSVTNIGRAAFYGSSLTSVSLPESVISIGGDGAFHSCKMLSSVTLPEGLTYISQVAFRDCPNLTSINLPSSITSLGFWAFAECGLNSVIVNWETPMAIDSDPFYSRGAITLYVPVGSKAAYAAADYWSEFKKIVEFTPCINFADENVKAICVANWDTDGDGELSYEEAAAVTELGKVFSDNNDITSFKELRFFTGLTEIGDGSFYGCINLTSIIIPINITSIDSYAFYGCENLSTLAITKKVTSLSGLAFEGCSSLSSIIVEEGNPNYDCRDNCNAVIETETNTLIVGCENTIIPHDVTGIGSWAFAGRHDMTYIDIPDEVTHIDTHAFYGCDALRSIVIPKGVSVIPDLAFHHDEGRPLPEEHLLTVKIKREIPLIVDYSNFPNRANATLCVPTGSKAAYEVADFWNEFKEIVEFTPSINFANDNVKAICVANWDSDGDGELSYEEAAAVTELGNVFAYNNEITSFNELQHFTGLTEIGDGSFWGCFNMKSIIIPNSVTTIGNSAFEDCGSLASVSIPNNVQTIGTNAFLRCGELTSVELPEGLTTIGFGAFAYCGELTSINFPNSLTSIEGWAFTGCNSLNSVYLPKGLLFWRDESTFADCHNIETAYINCILCCNPRRLFPETTTLIYGEDGGYEYFDFDLREDSLNTYESPITKEMVTENNRQIRIPVVIANRKVDIAQIQFDFRLAEGFSLAEDENGKKMVEMDKVRFDYDEDFGYSHSMTLTDFGDENYRVVLTSIDNLPIVEGCNASVYITLRLNDNIIEGNYEPMIHIFNIESSTPTAEKIKPNDSRMNVKVYLRDSGDFNHDDVVSVTDYAGVVRWVAGQGYEDQGVPEWVIFKASDVNEDREITVTDVAGIVNIILYGNYTGKTSNAKARRTESTSGASLSIEPFSISSGETKEITVNFSSAYTDLSQCQFDLTLPEGLSVAEVNGKAAIYPGEVIRSADGFSHMVSSAQREDGTLRVVCLSGSNEAFNDIEGSIVKIKIVADKEMKANSADIEISNVEFANTDASMVMGVGSTTPVSLGDGVTNIDPLKESSLNKYDIYSADGIQRDRLSRGLNIVRYIDGSTKKVMVK